MFYDILYLFVNVIIGIYLSYNRDISPHSYPRRFWAVLLLGPGRAFVWAPADRANDAAEERARPRHSRGREGRCDGRKVRATRGDAAGGRCDRQAEGATGAKYTGPALGKDQLTNSERHQKYTPNIT